MIRRGLLSLALILTGLCSSVVVHAEMVTTWDFTNGAQIDGWQIDGLDVRQGPDGLHIRGVGVMMRTVDATHRIDALNMIFAKANGSPAVFAWHRRTSPNNEFVQLGFGLNVGAPTNQEIPLHTITEWDPWSDVIGFKFETNDEIILSGVDFKGWTMAEKIGMAWTSFWNIDRVLAFSINFLWGPLTVFTPAENDVLYSTQPPMAWSAHRFSYAFLAIAAVLSAAYVFGRRLLGTHVPGRHGVLAFFTVFAVLWGIHDIRMGFEFVSNAYFEMRDYSFAEPGKKSFRNLLSFHDGLLRNMALFEAVPTYVVYAPDQSPMRKMAGYHTYPKSRPLFSDEPTIDQTLFYVFYDSTVSINEKQELVRDGVVVSKPGHVAKRINEYAYIFLVP